MISRREILFFLSDNGGTTGGGEGVEKEAEEMKWVMSK